MAPAEKGCTYMGAASCKHDQTTGKFLRTDLELSREAMSCGAATCLSEHQQGDFRGHTLHHGDHGLL